MGMMATSRGERAFADGPAPTVEGAGVAVAATTPLSDCWSAEKALEMSIADIEEESLLLAAAAKERRVDAKPHGEAERDGGAGGASCVAAAAAAAFEEDGDGGGPVATDPDARRPPSTSVEPLRLTLGPSTLKAFVVLVVTGAAADAFDLVRLRGCTLLIVLRLFDSLLVLVLLSPPRSASLATAVKL